MPGREMLGGDGGERRGDDARDAGVTVANARMQWDEGVRRFQATRGQGTRHRQLGSLVDAVQDELRRRVGQTFTLAELARAYEGSEDWVRDVVKGATPPRAEAGIRDTALVQDTAFAMYARGAADYRP